MRLRQLAPGLLALGVALLAIHFDGQAANPAKKVTAAGVERLKKALPKVKVTR